jgi:N-acetylneuraminate synthase
MANNHMGSVAHAKKIINEFSELSHRNKLLAGIKLQFRNLDTFIHPDFQNRNDLKYVKRFNDTRLSKEQFEDIVNYIVSKGLLTITTPFDNESIPLANELNIDILKVASCSVDDWPLIEEISKVNKKIIVSTAGADFNILQKVHKIFKKESRDFSFMHCVGEYPTPIEVSELDRIKRLKLEFPDTEIGLSTHESPHSKSITAYAVAMGCTIIEKHVGSQTDDFQLNDYSLSVGQMQTVIDEINLVLKASIGKSENQNNALNSLKRGVYLRNDISAGSILTDESIYYAMPVQDGFLNASSYYNIIGSRLLNDLKKNDGVKSSDITIVEKKGIIEDIKIDVMKLLNKANVTITKNDSVELSCHYSLDEFSKFGAIIISKINRDYCKKIIVMTANQSHPTHRHLIKEESFELLYGDCELVLNGRQISLKKGEPILINTKVDHSFSTNLGCVVEEISTTHINGDSVYQDPMINKLLLSDRKIMINLIK